MSKKYRSFFFMKEIYYPHRLFLDDIVKIIFLKTHSLFQNDDS